jgi:hypothetical protein
VQVAAEGHCLRVEVQRAENLPCADTLGGGNAFCVLAAQSEAGLQMFQTATVQDSRVRCWCLLSFEQPVPTGMRAAHDP